MDWILRIKYPLLIITDPLLTITDHDQWLAFLVFIIKKKN